MKRIIPLLFLLCPIISVCDEMPSLQEQMLDSEIEKLTRERDEKYAALQECAKNVKGFKIAGITTLAATGVGVYANIRLAQKLNEKSGGGKGKSARVVDNRPQEEKDEDSCVVLCGVGAAPEECNC